ncbi:MAG: twin-arginine translocase TatA/TatE family subunit [Halobacteriovoraceae bacterium]|nr:twin-arginine translocase TatA/TatE family subunit [Halobacteriovoraceae bacterium]
MFGLGMGEGLILLSLAVLFFGGKKLPALGRSMGSAIRNVKQGLRQDKIEDKPDNNDHQ